jgi:molybdopterin synthase catalytic subunit
MQNSLVAWTKIPKALCKKRKAQQQENSLVIFVGKPKEENPVKRWNLQAEEAVMQKSKQVIKKVMPKKATPAKS